MSCIYAIIDKKKNAPVYIGQTIKTYQERWKEHLSLARNGKGFAIHDAMRKYGLDNFEIKLIEDNIEDANILDEKEKFWIKELKTHISENGYNVSRGGEHNPGVKKNLIYQYDIEGNFIQEFESVSEAARVVQGNHGNIIKAINGEINIAYNYRWSYKKLDKLESLKTNHTGKSKKINQYTLDNVFIRSFDSSKEAARFLNKNQGNISMAANGHRKSAYGFKWKYAD